MSGPADDVYLKLTLCELTHLIADEPYASVSDNKFLPPGL